MPRAAKPHFSESFAVPVGGGTSPRAAIGEHGLRRLPKLGPLITDFARFINSEIALRYGRQGAATHGDLLVGSGGTHEENARSLEGGLVGHALWDKARGLRTAVAAAHVSDPGRGMTASRR